MDIWNIVKSLEALVIELAFWIILFPKTFLVMLFMPAKITTYCRIESEKSKEDRFNEYMSPSLFWILGAVVPYVLYYNEIGLHNKDKNELSFIVSIMLLLLPVAFAWQHLAENKEEINRKGFFRFLYFQLYIFGVCTPFFLFVSDILPNQYRLDEKTTGGLGLIMIVWLLYAEMSFARNDPDIKGVARFILLGIIRAALIFFVFYLVNEVCSEIKSRIHVEKIKLQ